MKSSLLFWFADKSDKSVIIRGQIWIPGTNLENVKVSGTPPTWGDVIFIDELGSARLWTHIEVTQKYDVKSMETEVSTPLLASIGLTIKE